MSLRELFQNTYPAVIYIVAQRHYICSYPAVMYVIGARVAQWQRNRLVIGRLVGSNPLSGWVFGCYQLAFGGVPEWLIGTDCKSVALTGYAGSNPAPSTIVSINGLDWT